MSKIEMASAVMAVLMLGLALLWPRTMATPLGDQEQLESRENAFSQASGTFYRRTP